MTDSAGAARGTGWGLRRTRGHFRGALQPWNHCGSQPCPAVTPWVLGRAGKNGNHVQQGEEGGRSGGCRGDQHIICDCFLKKIEKMCAPFSVHLQIPTICLSSVHLG